jgi:hypothetical protein
VCNYTVIGHDYEMGYYLADDIYLDWSTIVKTMKLPNNRAEAEFGKAQKILREVMVFCKLDVQ